jgi:hypothetical protein
MELFLKQRIHLFVDDRRVKPPREVIARLSRLPG